MFNSAPKPDTYIVSERKVYSRKDKVRLMALLFILLAVIVAYALLRQYWSVTMNHQGENARAVAELRAYEKTHPFSYQLVPNADSAITISEPTDDTNTDTIVYQGLKANPLPTPADVAGDSAFTLPFLGTTNGAYVNNLPLDQRAKVFRMNDELTALTKHFNQLYPRKALAERLEDVAVVDSPIAHQPTYPSLSVVYALEAAYVMTKLDSTGGDNYTEIAKQLINRGISYGWYGESDVEASQSLFTQYVGLLGTTFDDLQITNVTAKNL